MRIAIFILLFPCCLSAQTFILNSSGGNVEEGVTCDSASVQTVFGTNNDSLGIWTLLPDTNESHPDGASEVPTLIADGLQYTSNGGGTSEGIETTGFDMDAICADSITVSADGWDGGGERIQLYYSLNDGQSWTLVFNVIGNDVPSVSGISTYRESLSAIETETDVTFRVFMNTFQNQGITLKEIRFH